MSYYCNGAKILTPPKRLDCCLLIKLIIIFNLGVFWFRVVVSTMGTPFDAARLK